MVRVYCIELDKNKEGSKIFVFLSCQVQSNILNICFQDLCKRHEILDLLNKDIFIIFSCLNIEQEWSYLRGGLTTVDRDYGWFNKIHHDIGTHVIHHLFPQIPHYHLEEAVIPQLLKLHLSVC